MLNNQNPCQQIVFMLDPITHGEKLIHRFSLPLNHNFVYSILRFILAKFLFGQI